MTMTDDDKAKISYADIPTETRMGQRPVPEGHLSAEELDERRADMPRRRRHGPRRLHAKGAPPPSLTGRILVWGGIGVAAAAVTAAAVMAGRHIGEIFADDHRTPSTPPNLGPRRVRPLVAAENEIADDVHLANVSAGNELRRLRGQIARQSENLQAELDAARDRAEQAEARLARLMAAKRKQSKSFVADVEQNTRKLGGSIDNAVGSLASAVGGFRNVAGQATSLISEFDTAARLIRNLLARGKDDVADAASTAKRNVERRTHNL